MMPNQCKGAAKMERNRICAGEVNKAQRLAARALLGGLLLAPALVFSARAQNDQQAEAQKKEVFLQPTGPYAVGTHEYLWIDQKRDEPFTKDPADKRHLLARVWYPAEAVPGKETAFYILDVNEYPEKSIYRKGEGFKTNSVTDAPLAASKRPFPVLVYQPGGGTARFIATFQAEQLASRGFVVVSADHPGFSETVLFPDGYRFEADTMLAPKETGHFRDDVLNNWGWLERDVFPTWLADASFTLDKVAELDKTPGQMFHQRLDIDRIGMMGWSFGGAAGVQMAKDDPRVKAVVDQDGQLFGDVWKTGISRPLMLMHHGIEDKAPKPEDNPVMKELIEKTQAQDRSLLEHSTNDWYEITIAKTQHGHFSDFLLFFPRNPAELDPHRAHEIIIAYTLAFFDTYLRGEKSDLLKAPSPEYPEVTFKKKS
jgi:predicted dienelactone hydrolase